MDWPRFVILDSNHDPIPTDLVAARANEKTVVAHGTVGDLRWFIQASQSPDDSANLRTDLEVLAGPAGSVADGWTIFPAVWPGHFIRARAWRFTAAPDVTLWVAVLADVVDRLRVVLVDYGERTFEKLPRHVDAPPLALFVSPSDGLGRTDVLDVDGATLESWDLPRVPLSRGAFRSSQLVPPVHHITRLPRQ